MESNTKDNGIEIEISALVDDSGNYSHFKIKEGNINRILNLDTGYVLNDTIEDATMVDEDFGLGKMYDGEVNKTDIRRRFSFKEYLTKGVNFEGYTGHVPSLQSIVNFLQVNEYLTKEIENLKGKSR